MGSLPPAGPASGAPRLWSPPPEFDEYRLIRLIGRGGTGRVYLALDTLLERPVAVKFIPALGPGALARFLVEARAAARIQHPNVVTLYRVGQLEGQPYLVSELVRGTRLDLLPRPLSWEQVVAIGKDLARGLDAAHRRGVLHRDIKPNNAMLTESGAVKLLDFGLAKLLPPPPGAGAEESAAGAAGGEALELGSVAEPGLVGTPYYMSPEAWAGEPLTTRSDVYSLGLVLYELCAGQSPFRDVPWTELAHAVSSSEPRPLAEAVPGVEPALAEVVERCLRRQPEERFASAALVLEALEQVGPRERGPMVSPDALPEGNPYRGLRPFEPEHRALFFGRGGEQRAVLERLRSEPFVLLTGDSGVGKSSLCLAGVLPAVAEGALGEERRWRCVRLVPGRHPTAALAAALAPALALEEEALSALLEAEPTALARRARAQLGREQGLVVYVDQLEELVALGEEAERTRAGLALGALAEGVGGVRLLASCRSDFLTRLTAVPGVGAAVPGALHLLGALSPQQVREAVVGPARMKGVRFESEALVEALVASAAEGALPLLQFTLAELWERREQAQGLIPQAALEALGGVEGALARHADAALERLLPEQREAARGLLRRLVTAQGTRARRTGQELAGGEERSRAALEALVRARLLVAREEAGTTCYELAHEALLHNWGTLARWLAEAVEHREVQERLEAAAAHWEQRGRAGDLLWGTRQILEAEVLEPQQLTPRELTFVEASRRAVTRRRWAHWALVAGFVLSLGLVAGGVRLRETLALEAQVHEQLSAAHQSLESLRHQRSALAASQQQALRLYDVGLKAEADEAWARLERQAASLREHLEAVGDRLERMLMVASARQEVREALADFLLERALLAEQQGEAGALPGLLQRLRVYDEAGERWRAWHAPARLTLEVAAPGVKVGGELAVEAELQPVPQVGLEHEPSGAPLSLGPRVGEEVEVPPGDWWLEVRAPGYEPARLPLRLERAERRRVSVPLLRKGQVPAGFAYVPPGQVRFGSAAEAALRDFFNAVPQHRLPVPGFLMARHEVTYAQWVAFLEALPPEERARRTPQVGTAYLGMLSLKRLQGRWRLQLHTGGVTYAAWAGEPLRYARRERRAKQDWRRLPVTGISLEDARAYTAWLARTGQVPGARLCTELEWERAARGEDGREYPHGNTLAPHEANIDLTYGKQTGGFGPDEVGSYPATRSPFGIDDLAGNVWEWTLSVLEPGQGVARGGSYYFSAGSARASNREVPEPGLRDTTVGMRVCAELPAGAR